MKRYDYLINELDLKPHPQGGYYRKTDLSLKYSAVKGTVFPLYTTIYFLLTDESPLHFHRLPSDEVWFFHIGDPLTIHSLVSGGSYEKKYLSHGFKHHFHHTVPAGTIFGSTVDEGYALVSCTSIPGGDLNDITLFTKKELLLTHSKHEKIINRLAYETLPE